MYKIEMNKLRHFKLFTGGFFNNSERQNYFVVRLNITGPKNDCPAIKICSFDERHG
jgi:hypothetical protein